MYSIAHTYFFLIDSFINLFAVFICICMDGKSTLAQVANYV